MFGIPETIEDAMGYAERLQNSYCAYGTPIEPKSHGCDCKFLGEKKAQRWDEQNGCCEARALWHFLKGMKGSVKLSVTSPWALLVEQKFTITGRGTVLTGIKLWGTPSPGPVLLGLHKGTCQGVEEGRSGVVTCGILVSNEEGDLVTQGMLIQGGTT